MIKKQNKGRQLLELHLNFIFFKLAHRDKCF